MKVIWGLDLVPVYVILNAKTEDSPFASFGRLVHALMVEGEKESEKRSFLSEALNMICIPESIVICLTDNRRKRSER